MLEEMERSVHDAICVVKRTLESGTVVPGGGAVEAALSIYLENFATTLVRLLLFLSPLSLLLFLSLSSSLPLSFSFILIVFLRGIDSYLYRVHASSWLLPNSLRLCW